MIGIIFVSNLKFCPYLTKYTNVLDKNKIAYQIIYWNRVDVKDEIKENHIVFNRKSKLKKSKILKVFDFLAYSIWLNKIIIKNRYKKMIILSTIPGIILKSKIIKNYNNKFIFDIRDYSYENIKLFFLREKKVIQNANFVAISSDGFREFLPKNQEYVTIHNFSYDELCSAREAEFKLNKSTRTNIGWVGTVRYYDHQVRLINKVADSKNFILHFFGIGPDYEKLKKYVDNNKLDNIKFHGEYSVSDKMKIMNQIDIVHNNYESKNTLETKYAVSNKFYDGLIFKKPQFVEPGSFKESLLVKYKVGISIDINKNDFLFKLKEYYRSIDAEHFNRNCVVAMENFKNEEEVFNDKLKDFIECEGIV